MRDFFEDTIYELSQELETDLIRVNSRKTVIMIAIPDWANFLFSGIGNYIWPLFSMLFKRYSKIFWNKTGNNFLFANLRRLTIKLSEKKRENLKSTWQYSDEQSNESTVLFSDRLTNEFPSVNGLQYFKYNPKIGCKLQKIINVKPEAYGKIWWFRGTSNNHIREFKVLNRTTCLLDIEELKIEKVYVYNDGVYWRNFIYIETIPSKKTGLYPYNKANIDRYFLENGPYYEEYGLYGHHKMTRREYDNSGYTKKNGKTINTKGKETLRVRYLTKYNLIICAHDNPINNNACDYIFKDILNGILYNEKSVEDIVATLVNLPKRQKNRL